MEKLDKEELSELVNRIRNNKGNDDEFNIWIQRIKQSVTHPEVLNVIIRNREGLSVEQIVDKLMDYN